MVATMVAAEAPMGVAVDLVQVPYMEEAAGVITVGLVPMAWSLCNGILIKGSVCRYV